MARPRARRSSRRNPPPGGEDELAEGPPETLNKGSNTPTPSLLLSRVQTPADVSAPTPASPRDMYTDTNLQRATKLGLELFI